ncbi:MAG: hypothetical protein K2K36_09725 [Muribaculaceae bacterium]|nr:hypothetical protein [Muribaculaceae bacterium]
MKVMKPYIAGCMLALTAATSLVSCKDDEAYDTQVTRNVSLTINGEPWDFNHDLGNGIRALFIYNENGDFYSNYYTIGRFALPSGKYHVFATSNADLLTPPTGFYEEVIAQDPETKQSLAISNPIEYNAGDAMSLDVYTRTGTLRLKAMDVKADKSYSYVRATVKTPVTGWNVAAATVATGTPIELTREKDTSGGIGYTEDLVLIGSADHKVTVHLDYLDADKNLVRSADLNQELTVLPNMLTTAEFELNNPNEQVSIACNVSVTEITWGSGTIYPSLPVEIPEGYVLVEAGQDINAAYNAQKNDESVDEIRLFLQANASYSFSRTTLERVNKSVSIIGQRPGYGQSAASVSLNAVTLEGDFDHFRMENLSLAPGSRFFNLAATLAFNINEIAFTNCSFDRWNGVMWNQTSRTDRQQTVNTMKLDGCRFTNYTAATNAMFKPATGAIAPIYNWVFSGCLFHGANFGSRTAVILSDVNKIDGNLNITVEGCAFIDTRGTDFTFFDIDAQGASNCTLNVRDNIVGGAQSGFGTWFNLGRTTSVNASGNTRTAGYAMKAYGVDTPAESTLTYDDLLRQQNLN